MGQMESLGLLDLMDLLGIEVHLGYQGPMDLLVSEELRDLKGKGENLENLAKWEVLDHRVSRDHLDLLDREESVENLEPLALLDLLDLEAEREIRDLQETLVQWVYPALLDLK